MLRPLFNFTYLLGIWIGLFFAKYVTLSLISQAYWRIFNLHGLVDLLVTFVIGIIWFVIFSGIAHAFGISLYHGMTADLSREKYTVTTHIGEIKRGFISDRVELREESHTTSEYDEMSKIFGYFMLFDMALFYFGLIESWMPSLRIF